MSDTAPAPARAGDRACGAQLLEQVLVHCRRHPYQGEDLDAHTREITWFRQLDGRVRFVNIPRHIRVSAQLLDLADPALLSFTGGALTFHVLPAPLRYRPLYPAATWWAVTFELIQDPGVTATC